MKNFIHYIFFYILILLISVLAQAQTMIGDTQVETTPVVTGLDTPWEILWGPDGYIWITERKGDVSRLNPETGEHSYLLNIADVHEQSESGLLGMALHPDFPGTAWVYLVYNYYDGGIKERIVRYEFTGAALENPFTLLEDIGGSGNHNGSRLVIDENDKLFVTTGDATNTSTSQNESSLSGKILRMNLDGSIPDDNPIAGNYLWTLGHRNPQGLVIAPNGKMYSSEHGPANDDELNLIEKGRNYGWPQIHGFCDEVTEETFCNQNNIMEPLFAWTPTLAVAGIDYYNHNAIPEWKNSILMTNLKASRLESLKLNEDGSAITETATWFNGTYGRLRDVCVSPDGRVFIATSNRDGRGSPAANDDKIVEIKASGSTGIGLSQKQNPDISIYPNPMSANATVKLQSEMQNARLTIFDLTGKPVFRDVITGGEYELERGKLQKGYYILEIGDGNRYKKRSLLAVF